jgi:hypothetical protein
MNQIIQFIKFIEISKTGECDTNSLKVEEYSKNDISFQKEEKKQVIFCLHSSEYSILNAEFDE